LSVLVAVRDSDATVVRTRQQRYDAMKEKDRVMRFLLAWDGTAAISVVLAVFACHDPRTADIPLIAISAGPELLESPLLAVDGRLCKPFKNDDLYGIVARWLHRA